MAAPFLTIKRWQGINNQSGPNAKLSSMELKAGECVEATNINIDDKNRINLRRGSVQKLTGAFRNLDPAGSGLCIQGDTNLVILRKNVAGAYSYVVIKSGLTPGAVMSYVIVNGGLQVWCTNNHEIGFVTPDLQWHDLPAVDAGVNNSAIATKLQQTRKNLPPGYFIDHFNGRMFTMQDGIVSFSDSMAFHRCHNENGFFMTAGRGSMMKSVQNGIWYADGNIWFISGHDIADSDLVKKADYNAISGAITTVPGNLTGVRDLVTADDCVMFWTENGLCVGGPSGEFYNLTIQTYHPVSKYNGGHSIFRQRPGMNQVVTILN